MYVSGKDTHPDWYYNILANPQVTVEPKRTRLYDKMVEMMPGFAEYPRKTMRQILVIVLSRIA